MDRSSFFTRLKKSAEISSTSKINLNKIDPKVQLAEQRSTFSSLVKSGATVVGNPFSNYDLKVINRPTSSDLSTFAGPVTYELVSHLVKRTCFNASISEIKRLVATGSWTTIFNELFSSYTIDPPPVNPAEIQSDPLLPYPNSTGDFIGVSSPYNGNLDKQRNNLIYAQWNNYILNSPINIREKMVVFLSSVLVEQQSTIGDARFFYGYLDLLRNNAIGNYKDLVKKIVIDPGMLIYLNGSESTKSAPNENFARELQELFTIGKGAQTATGDYTNYSEKDVQSAAKVLTGWTVTAYQRGGTVSAVFNPSTHDSNSKQFSADYGNATINNVANPELEYADLIDLIFSQHATAVYIAGRIYRHFVYYYADDALATKIVGVLADTLRSNNYELLPVLKQLLQSNHFFDPLNIGCEIKDPITFTAGLQRNLGLQANGIDVISQASGLFMRLGNPDQVAGWKATYEAPDYAEWWINSISIQNRIALSDSMILGNPDALINIVTAYISVPSDPNILIDELAKLFFPSSLTSPVDAYNGPITQTQHDFLLGIILPGLTNAPYEWNDQVWSKYIANPTGANEKATLAGKLIVLFKFMFSMAEYHLS